MTLRIIINKLSMKVEVSMIVCVCHGISDRDLERVALEEGGNFRSVVRKTRACSDCGSCQSEVKDICKSAKRSLPLWNTPAMPAVA